MWWYKNQGEGLLGCGYRGGGGVGGADYKARGVHTLSGGNVDQESRTGLNLGGKLSHQGHHGVWTDRRSEQ